MSEHFRFSVSILRRLGEELTPNADQGILELVRNSYDADAVECRIELQDTESRGGSVRITDTGSGMSFPTLRDGWLVIGSSAKEDVRVTPKGRRVVGKKGLGRMAALRLGNTARIVTRPEKSTAEFRLEIRWRDFDRAMVVEDVPIEIEKGRRDVTSVAGTTIELEDLHEPLTKNHVKRLARALLLLSDPFGDSQAFRPVLVAPEFEDLAKLVANAYFEEAQLKLVARVDEKGLASAEVLDWKGQELFRAVHADISRKSRKSALYQTPQVTFELWSFSLDANIPIFSSRPVTVTEIREWLRAFGGVHVYHNSMRVHPYGDEGFDWLSMNLARARSPELRPSTNNSIGRILIDDPKEIFRQKTDRTGFIEDPPFLELRDFAVDALDWMARRRLADRESRRVKESTESSASVESASRRIATALKTVPPGARKVVEQAIDKYRRATDRQTQSLREDLQLYRTLSTVGTTSAVLAHEVRKPVEQIDAMSRLMARIARKKLGEDDHTFDRPLGLIQKSAAAIRTFANVTSKILDRTKRRSGRVSVNDVLDGIFELFQPFLLDAKVEVIRDQPADDLAIYGTVASLESIVANLLTNSISAFSYEHAKPVQRKISVHTSRFAKGLQFVYADNGPGIKGITLSDIWLPGQTTTPGGTGLGLTIVKDCVTELGGSIEAFATGELGGAEFRLDLPLLDSKG
jgi:signal transduction histidine kinase